MPHIDLLELPYFQGISIDAVVSFIELLDPKQFATNSVLVHEGERIQQPLYIATTGRVMISKKNPEGLVCNLAELHTPTLVGEIEFFCQTPAVATATAMSPVACYVLTRPIFEKLFDVKHPALCTFILNVARVASHRLAIADEMMAHLVRGEDLAHLRRTIFTKMTQADECGTTTGVFKSPLLKKSPT